MPKHCSRQCPLQQSPPNMEGIILPVCTFSLKVQDSFFFAANRCHGVQLHVPPTNCVIETLQNASDSDDDIRPSRGVRRSSGFLSAEKKKGSISGLDGADSSDGFSVQEAHITPSKKNKTRPTRGRSTKESEVITLDSESEPEQFQPKPTRSRNNGESSKKPAGVMTPKNARRSKHVELSEDEIQLPVHTNGKGKPKSAVRSQNKKPPFVEIDSEVDEDPIVSSPKRSQRPLHRPIPTSDSEEEDEDVRSSPVKRRQRPRVIQDGDEDDKEPIISPLKRTRQVVESEDSEDIIASPMKRRRPAVRQDSDSDDLPSLIEISRRKGKGKERVRSPSDPPETPMRTRQATARRHRTAKEKTMELLKRRRAGENIEELTESESDEEEDEDDFQKLDEFDDEEESPEQQKKSSKSRSKVKRQRGDSSDEEAGESDFVIEDNEGPLGVPDYASLMPLEFTQAAHKPLKEHFRDVVEWMIQNKLNPGFTWNDPVYNQAFQKL